LRRQTSVADPVTLASAIIGGFVGALIGYFFRAREFRRDQRLKVYGEFVRALLDVARSGAVLQSMSLRLGDLTDLRVKLTHAKERAGPYDAGAPIEMHAADPHAEVEVLEQEQDLYVKAWQKHEQTRAAFEESAARLRLLASWDVRNKSEAAETWVSLNVHGVPPFARDFHPDATAGAAGPAAVEQESIGVARAFVDGASKDVTGWARQQVSRRASRLLSHLTARRQ
jgi:hypothetical protein